MISLWKCCINLLGLFSHFWPSLRNEEIESDDLKTFLWALALWFLGSVQVVVGSITKNKGGGVMRMSSMSGHTNRQMTRPFLHCVLLMSQIATKWLNWLCARRELLQVECCSLEITDSAFMATVRWMEGLFSFHARMGFWLPGLCSWTTRCQE